MKIFLLTKTPQSKRTKLSLRLLAKSQDVVVYLAGDGVYNLLGQPLAALVPRHKILACLEDLEARGVSSDGKATVPADFYESLVDEMMREGSMIYTF
jgi:tRNA 2-thiouridine synthesizing protein B